MLWGTCKRFFSVLVCGATSFLFVLPAHAQLSGAADNINQTAEAAGISGGGDLIQIIGRLINIFLGTLGVIFLGLLLYAGYLWMTAAGDPKKGERAQHTIRNAVNGLVIIASSFAITSFILKSLAGDGGGFGGVSSNSAGGAALVGASGSLGGGVIESHLPVRNATGVPRNTPIIMAMKEAIKPESFIEGWTEATSNTTDGLNAANIQIYRTDAGVTNALTSDKARVRYTSDFKTYVIKPIDYLGSPTQNIGYSVDLTGGSKGIQKLDGSPALSGAFGGGYSWQFEVSTLVDLTPPTIAAVVPQAGGQYPRNIIIQIQFNEAVDPTATTGKMSDGFSNLQVFDGVSPTPISGEFRISNQYQTVEFVPDAPCGANVKNSCGKEVYCLPSGATIQAIVKAATVDPAALPQAQLTTNGYDGVVDVVGNSLDGNRNGVAEGPLGNPTDTYVWSFGTTSEVKLSPPVIESTMPSHDPQSGGTSNVPLDQPVTAVFDSLLQSSTLNTDHAKIDAHGRDETNPDTFWWSVGMKLLTIDGAEIDATKNPPEVPAKASLVISHRPFVPSGETPEDLNFYDPYILSGVQDAYQNCFNPAAACGTGIGSPHCCNNIPTNDPAGCKPLLNP